MEDCVRKGSSCFFAATVSAFIAITTFAIFSCGKKPVAVAPTIQDDGPVVEARHPGDAAFHELRPVQVVDGDVIRPVLINGAPVPDGARPNVVRIQTGNAGCTAAVVGPRVISTAAHCGGNGATSKFKVNGVEYTAKLTRHPKYPSTDVDLALGLIEKEVSGIVYGQIPKGTNLIKVGDAVRLIGFGCTQPGGTGGNDGVLREGTSKVTGFTGNDAVTGGVSGGAALCYGDSGGPAEYELTIGNQLMKFFATVNSKGNIRDTSYLSRWDTNDGQSFVTSWAQANGVDVCGITKECGNPGPNSPKFNIDSEAVAFGVTVKSIELQKNLDFVKTHVQNLVRFFESGPTFN